jgi:hypothetical protein
MLRINDKLPENKPGEIPGLFLCVQFDEGRQMRVSLRGPRPGTFICCAK